MRDISTDDAEILLGSRSGDRIIAHAWYDGALVAPDLQVTEWSIRETNSRQVKTQVDITVVDEDGSLAPWALDDPLAPGGSRLQVIYEVGGGGQVNYGWYVVSRSVPSESWRVYPGENHSLRWVPGGGVIPVEGDDLTRLAVDDELLANESPPTSSTVITEIRRMLDGIMGVVVSAEVDANVAVPNGTVYEKETPRLNVVEDLLSRINATHRMTGDGMLEIIPIAKQPAVWDIVPGEEGALVQVVRDLDLTNMKNAVVATSTELDTEVVGRAFESFGPLAWEGPAWRRPEFISTSLIDSTEEAYEVANSALANGISNRSVTLRVTCLPHPGVQVGDWVRVASPTITGSTVDLVGRVDAKTLRGSRSGVAAMTLEVTCDYIDVQTVATAIRRWHA